MRIGLAQETVARNGWALNASEAMALIGKPDTTLIDLREQSEREKQGVIPNSVHLPYQDLRKNLQPDGLMQQLAGAKAKHLVFYCAFGERSAMAVQAAQDAGLKAARHMQGGVQAWKLFDGPMTRQ